MVRGQSNGRCNQSGLRSGWEKRGVISVGAIETVPTYLTDRREGVMSRAIQRGRGDVATPLEDGRGMGGRSGIAVGRESGEAERNTRAAEVSDVRCWRATAGTGRVAAPTDSTATTHAEHREWEGKWSAREWRHVRSKGGSDETQCAAGTLALARRHSPIRPPPHTRSTPAR